MSFRLTIYSLRRIMSHPGCASIFNLACFNLVKTNSLRAWGRIIQRNLLFSAVSKRISFKCKLMEIKKKRENMWELAMWLEIIALKGVYTFAKNYTRQMYGKLKMRTDAFQHGSILQSLFIESLVKYLNYAFINTNFCLCGLYCYDGLFFILKCNFNESVQNKVFYLRKNKWAKKWLQ